MKTLIVDDDFICRAKMTAVMESFGECRTAEDAHAAIGLYNESLNRGVPFDVVTLDIAMPGMDGKELLHAIREIQVNRGEKGEREPKIIMVTGHPDRDNLVASFRAGCDDFIVKPVSMEIMVQKLVKLGVIGGPTMEPAGPEAPPGPGEGSDSLPASPLPEVEDGEGERKILIVDDDHASRIKMKVIMDHFGSCTLAASGNEAVEAFREALLSGRPHGYVMLDLDMPVMDGREVLTRMREIEAEFKVRGGEGALIMMVTGHSRAGDIARCLEAGCDEYIVKPFTLKTVEEKMSGLESRDGTGEKGRAGGVRKKISRMIGDVYRTLHGKETPLPMLPEINLKLSALIRKGADIKELSELLKNDLSIASHLMKIANSAWYRGTEKITSLDDALTRLGITEIRRQVELLGNRNLYDSIDDRFARIVDGLWNHSLTCANAAAVTAWMANENLTADPFMLGLTHDIGKLVLLSIIDKMEKTGAWGRDVPGESIYRLLSEYHPRFGATLLERWKFPKSFITTVLYQETPGEAESLTRELLVVVFSNALAESMGGELPPERNEALLKLDSTVALELTPEMIGGISGEVERRMEALKTLFGNLR